MNPLALYSSFFFIRVSPGVARAAAPLHDNICVCIKIISGYKTVWTLLRSTNVVLSRYPHGDGPFLTPLSPGS